MDAVAGIERVYGALPQLACQGKCADSCGPIFMSRVEWERIITRLGYEPKVAKFTTLLDLQCPMLSPDRRCNVYDIRPLICRLWGLVEKMKCPWGCVPDRWLTDAEARGLLSRVEELGA